MQEVASPAKSSTQAVSPASHILPSTNESFITKTTDTKTTDTKTTKDEPQDAGDLSVMDAPASSSNTATEPRSSNDTQRPEKREQKKVEEGNGRSERQIRLTRIDRGAFHKTRRNGWIKGRLLPEAKGVPSRISPDVRLARFGEIVRGVGYLVGIAEQSPDGRGSVLVLDEKTKVRMALGKRQKVLVSRAEGKPIIVIYYPTFPYFPKSLYELPRVVLALKVDIELTPEASSAKKNWVELCGCLAKVWEDGVVVVNYVLGSGQFAYTPVRCTPLEGWTQDTFVLIRGYFDLEKGGVVMTEGETLSFVSDEELAEHLPPEVWQVPPLFPPEQIELERQMARKAKLYESKAQLYMPNQNKAREKGIPQQPVAHAEKSASAAVNSFSPPSAEEVRRIAVQGKMEINIKVNELPKAIDAENGHKRMFLLCDGAEVSVTLRPKLYNKFVKDTQAYPLWVANFRGTLGPRTERGFVLNNPGVTVFEKKPKEPKTSGDEESKD
ncbi:hypothetical protein L6R29_06945 [Myxococcota bacterium]|nr:hypothetical protein [Myxococcota bacterium]